MSIFLTRSFKSTASSSLPWSINVGLEANEPVQKTEGLSTLKEKSQLFIELIKRHSFYFPPPLWKLLFFSTILQLSLAILLSH